MSVISNGSPQLNSVKNGAGLIEKSTNKDEILELRKAQVLPHGDDTARGPPGLAARLPL